MGRQPIGFARLLSVLVMGELICSVESNMIFVAIGQLYRIYGDPVKVGWLITAFTLSAAGAAAICSRLGDLYGRARLLQYMILAALSGSLISSVSDDLGVIIFGRALQGCSMAILPLCYGLLREHAPADKLALGVGILGGTYSFGVGIGAVLGGFIVDAWRWQGIFVVSAAFAAITLVLAAVMLPPSRRAPRPPSLDLLGGVLFLPPVTMLLLVLGNLRTWGWSSPLTLTLLCGSVPLATLWVWHELRQAHPLIDLRLLRDPVVARANIGVLLCMSGPAQLTMVIMALVQQPGWTGVGFGVSALVAGLIKVPTNVSSGSAMIVAGHIAGRWGMGRVVVGGAAMMTAGWLLLAISHHSLWFVIATTVILVSTGVTIVFATLPGIIIAAAPEERTSEATGMSQVGRAVGAAIASQLISAVLASTMVSNGAGETLPAPVAFTRVLAMLAAMSAATLLLMLSLRAAERRRAASAAGEPPSSSLESSHA